MVNQVLIFLFILLLPTQLGKHFFMDFSYLSGVRVDYLAPTLYLTDILALSLIIYNFKFIKPLFKSISFYIFLNVVLLNIFFAINPYISLYKAAKLFELFFLFVVLKNVVENNKWNEKILIALNIGAGVELLLSLLQLAYKHAIQGPFYYLGERYVNLSMPDIAKTSLNGVEFLRAYGSFSHPNSMAGFNLLLYFFVLTSDRFLKNAVLKYVFMVLSALLIFCSFAKIPIVIFFILNLWYVVRNPSALPCTFCRVSRIIVIAAISSIVLFAKGDPLSLLKRSDLFNNAMTVFSQHILFGTGLGGYVIAQDQFPAKYFYFFVQPVHNIFLLYLAEAGAVLTAVTFYYLIKYFRSHPRNQTYYYLVTIVFLTGSLDHYWLTLQQNMFLLPLLFVLL
ncbi:MAG: hypothetical protein ABIO02_05005 [Patescibacteria group bacterium]